MAAWDQCGYTGSRAQEGPALLFFHPRLKSLADFEQEPCISVLPWALHIPLFTMELLPRALSSHPLQRWPPIPPSGGRVWAPDSDPARANVSAKMNAQSDKPPASVLEKVMPFL